MLRFLQILSLALATAFAAGSAKAIDPFFPTFGNNGINVIHYDLDLSVTPDTGRLQAEAKLLILAQTRLSSFTLDLHGLTVSKATVNGAAATFSQANDKLRITPRWPLHRGAVFKLVVKYGGVPTTLQDPTFPSDPFYQLGWFRYGKASYVVSEPVGASTFYPANDEPTDKATFSYAITVPAAYTAAANGALKWVTSHGGKKTFFWVMRQPMTTWLATVHINKFTLTLRHAPDRTPVRVYSTENTPAFEIDNLLLAKQMLPYFERLIGQYPFDSYGSVVVDDPDLYYALETQAMSTFPTSVPPDYILDEAFVSHELAHQWFGNKASVKHWKDLWLAEGFATYLELLWPHRNDPAGFKEEMEANYQFVVDEEMGPVVVDSPEEIFDLTVYYRGAAALYALRQKVGDPTFFRILRAYLFLHRDHNNATTEDFIRIAVVVSGKPSVGPLLRHWLYDEEVPALAGYTPTSTSAATAKAFAAKECGRRPHRTLKSCD